MLVVADATKHIGHLRDVGGVPIGKIMAKARSAIEHAQHISYGSRPPATDIAVEACRPLKGKAKKQETRRW